MAGTGLPIPNAGAVILQGPGLVDADRASSARAWTKIADVGDKVQAEGLGIAAQETHQQQARATADFEIDNANAMTKLRDQYAGDPQGYQTAARAHVDGVMETVPGWLEAHAKSYLNGKLNSGLAATLSEKRSTDQSLAQDSLNARRQMADADVMTLAAGGDIKTPAGIAALATHGAIVDSSVTAGLMAPDKAELLKRDLQGRAQGEVAARSAVQVYQEQGFKAAVDHLVNDIRDNPNLTLTAAERQRAFNRGLSAVTLRQREDQQDRAGIVETSKGLRAQFDSNQPVDPGDLKDTLDALKRTGAAAEFRALTIRAATHEIAAPYLATLNLAGFGNAMRELRGDRAQGVDTNLLAVTKRAAEISGVKFIIGDKGGVRDQATQDNLVAGGFSQTRNSNHLTGRALDLIPVIDGKPSPNASPEQFAQISAAMKQASQELGVPIGWGGDWQNFKDYAHFELPRGGAPAGKPAGLVEAGNIDLGNRPVVKNPDGSISTVRSMSFNDNGKEVLIPTVAADGSGILSNDAAIEQYRKTGQHLGKFDTPENATAYALNLHKAQEAAYVRPGTPAAARPGSADVPYAAEITQKVQAVFVDQARKAWPEFKKQIDQGKMIDPENFQAIRDAAELSNDANWKQQVEEAAVANHIGTAIAEAPIGQQQAVADQAAARLGGNVAKTVQAAIDRRMTMVHDDPVSYAIEQDGKPPDALDLSSSQTARTGIAQRVDIARGVASQQAVPPGNPLRAAERTAIAGAITNGKPDQAAVALDAISSIPDDMLVPALKNDDVKSAILGATRSNDPAKYGVAMSFLNKMWQRSPETTSKLFGSDVINDLQTWQVNRRYMTAEQLAADRTRASADPQVVKQRELNTAEGMKQARYHSFDDVVKQFDTSWWIVPGPLARAAGFAPPGPVNTNTRDAMMGDFQNIYSRIYAATPGVPDKAAVLDAAVKQLKTKWTTSPTNGGRIMLNAPETATDGNGNALYPAVNGSYKWMGDQIESEIEQQNAKFNIIGGPVGKAGGAWNYELVPDQQTASEFQRGVRPTYQISFTDARTGISEILPKRFGWDPAQPIEKRNTSFAAERARVLGAQDMAAQTYLSPGGF